ncbi:hypothetical protein [Methanopyrus kandleri]|uniref:Predicted membrane protein n=2 Tax=Methanopyrus kandleri TaxID=2320 RepID=Q8TW83_METKA|nr:hypothetical protein [Methanopyrus kandleri]AAM02366.1 Predicted membrane protein [Methanopyrus kandleri AV19]HII69791.1 hypothetical protein [Methanopyrus kandleri]
MGRVVRGLLMAAYVGLSLAITWPFAWRFFRWCAPYAPAAYTVSELVMMVGTCGILRSAIPLAAVGWGDVLNVAVVAICASYIPFCVCWIVFRVYLHCCGTALPDGGSLMTVLGAVLLSTTSFQVLWRPEGRCGSCTVRWTSAGT